jgi:hypothetical protein
MMPVRPYDCMMVFEILWSDGFRELVPSLERRRSESQERVRDRNIAVTFCNEFLKNIQINGNFRRK